MSPRTRDSDTPRRRRLAIVLGVCLPTPRYECQQTQTALLSLSPPAATRSCSRSLTPVSDLYLFILASLVTSQDGWWRLEHEEVVASAPDEESGAGVA